MSGTDQRDGAPTEFKQHYDVRVRRSGSGEMVYTRLEQLLVNGYITPEQSEAGRRWAWNFRVAGLDASGRSCLDISPRGVNWNPSEAREDASRAYHAAKQALDGKRSPAAGTLPSEVVTMLCVNDWPFTKIALMLGVSRERVQGKILPDLLVTLAEHYSAEDKRIGRNSTAHTKEAALAHFEPEVAPRRT